MTVEEAKCTIIEYKPVIGFARYREALNVAISALEEIQQYREYREIFESHFTEDALKLFSDKEEFSKWLERGKWHVLKCDELGREVEEYRAIGTVSEFRELKEKATAKKPIESERNNLTVWDCPQCGNELYSGQKFCDECGKAIADEFD